MEFMHALVQFNVQMIRLHNSGVLHVRAGTGTARELCQAELSFTEQFWTQHAALLAGENWKVPLSCAVDASLDGEFAIARIYIRCFAFLRAWTTMGREAFIADLHSSSPESVARLEPLLRCMDETKTDRGCSIYVAEQVPCGCTDAIEAANRALPVTGKCLNPRCERQLPRAQLHRCSRCRNNLATYCCRQCQRADWPAHKQECVPHGQVINVN